MKKTFFVSILSIGATLMFSAMAIASIKPETFAYGMQLEVVGNNAFSEVELPLEIYQGVSRRDLGDLRVFNADLQVVPHAMRKPVTQRLQKNNSISPLPFFPISANKNQKIADIAIHVARNKQGTIVDVNTTKKSPAGKNKEIISYLLDASSLKKSQTINQIELTWQDTGSAFLGKVVVDYSSDLVSWHHLSSATIARLDYQGHRLYRNKIRLNRNNYQYLRLTWPQNQVPIKLSKVIAITQESYIITTPRRQWLQLKSEVLPAKKIDAPHRFYVDLQAYLPVDRIKIKLPVQNSLANVKLFSSTTKDGPMQEQWRGLVYNLTLQGQIIQTSEINIRPTSQRYWLIEVEKNEAQTPPPVLDFGWLPDRLVFLQQGHGPFLIAYGSSQIKPTNFHIGELIRKYRSPADKQVRPQLTKCRPQYILGGKDKLRPTHTLPWRKYLLWLALISGVVIIGWMSLSLFKQMRLVATQNGDQDK